MTVNELVTLLTTFPADWEVHVSGEPDRSAPARTVDRVDPSPLYTPGSPSVVIAS